MRDAITKFGQSLIQHGHHNDRIYVMKLSSHDVPDIARRLYDMALANKYSKIFVKVPTIALETFMKAGYDVEAYVPGFYNGLEDGYFVAKYLDGSRKMEKRHNVLARALSKASSTTERCKAAIYGGPFKVEEASPVDAPEIAGLYGKIFSTHPFPVNDPDYLRFSMSRNLRYYFIRSDDRVVSASSLMLDYESGNAEMTDFATAPKYQGHGLSKRLLQKMEEEVKKEGLKMAYTIARATSYPINRVFSNSDYSYGGTLTNNTNICGSYESMNVWYKALSAN
jgi:putative beta-lysine N-acetyltransferase